MRPSTLGCLNRITITIWVSIDTNSLCQYYVSMNKLPLVAILLVFAGVSLGACGTSSKSTESGRTAAVLPTSQELAARLLSPSDLGAGWQQVPASDSDTKAASFACKALGVSLKSVPNAFGMYVTASGGLFAESVKAYPNAAAQYKKGVAGLAKCGESPVVFPEVDGVSSVATVAPMAVPRLGDGSVGYVLSLEVGSYPIVIDVIFLREGHLVLGVEYGVVDRTTSVKSLISYAREALSKVTGESVAGI